MTPTPDTDRTRSRDRAAGGGAALAAGILLMLVLGTVHAFSVFLENAFAVSRAAASATYSLALVFLTAGVLFGHVLFRIVSGPALCLAVSAVAAVGCLLAAWAAHVAVVWLGYGVLFGGANGLGYAYALQSAAQANPHRAGFAMGVITAAYALGAAVSPPVLQMLIEAGGFAAAMKSMAVVLIVVGPLSALLYRQSGMRLKVDTHDVQRSRAGIALLLFLWLGYGSAVAAGLMAIGHATGIADAAGLGPAAIVAAPAIIALFNMGGSLGGGLLADRMPISRLLAVLALVSSGALVWLALSTASVAILAGLGLVGLAYGATIAVYPAYVSSLFGQSAGVRAYGVVFTAWGFAGLVAPITAGAIYGETASYTTALVAAAAFGIASACVVTAADRTIR